MSVTPSLAGPAVGLALNYAAFFAFIGVAAPFFPLWLEARELTPTQIAVILALPQIMRVLATQGPSSLADRSPQRAHVALGLLTVSAALLWGYAAVDGFVAIAILAGLFAASSAAIVPLLDSMTLSAARTDGIDYGRVRAWGSIAYVAANGAAGLAIGVFGVESVPMLMAALLTLGAALALSLPRRRGTPVAAQAGGAGALLRNAPFMRVTLASALIQASHAYFYSFATIVWIAAGHSGAMIGLFWAAGVVAEIVLFTLARPALARLSPSALMRIGASGAILRWVLLPFAAGAPAILALQLLHGLSFGATHVGTLQATSDLVPEARLSTAQGIVSVVHGAAMAIAVVATGLLHEALAGWSWWVMAALAALGLVLLAAGRPQPQRRLSAGETSAEE